MLLMAQTCLCIPSLCMPAMHKPACAASVATSLIAHRYCPAVMFSNCHVLLTGDVHGQSSSSCTKHFVLRLFSPAGLLCKQSVFTSLSRHKAQMAAITMAHDAGAEEQRQRLCRLQVLPLACIALYGTIQTILLSLHLHRAVVWCHGAVLCVVLSFHACASYWLTAASVH